MIAFSIQNYCKFLLASTNQHGVHSPFVYELVTKCFYDRTNKDAYVDIKKLHRLKNSSLSLRTSKLLYRLISYLGIATIYIPPNKNKVIHRILATQNSITITNTLTHARPFDLAFLDLDTLTPDIDFLHQIATNTHNDSVIVIHGIYTSEKNRAFWNKSKTFTGVTASIDIYHLGFIFFRKEQVPEHFTIRV